MVIKIRLKYGFFNGVWLIVFIIYYLSFLVRDQIFSDQIEMDSANPDKIEANLNFGMCTAK